MCLGLIGGSTPLLRLGGPRQQLEAAFRLTCNTLLAAKEPIRFGLRKPQGIDDVNLGLWEVLTVRPTQNRSDWYRPSDSAEVNIMFVAFYIPPSP